MRAENVHDLRNQYDKRPLNKASALRLRLRLGGKLYANTQPARLISWIDTWGTNLTEIRFGSEVTSLNNMTNHTNGPRTRTRERDTLTTSPVRPPPKKHKGQPRTHTSPVNTVAESSQSAHPGTQTDTHMEERPPLHSPRNPVPNPRQPKKRLKRHNPPDNTKPITSWFKPPSDHQHTPTPEDTPTGKSNWKRTYTQRCEEPRTPYCSLVEC